MQTAQLACGYSTGSRQSETSLRMNGSLDELSRTLQLHLAIAIRSLDIVQDPIPSFVEVICTHVRGRGELQEDHDGELCYPRAMSLSLQDGFIPSACVLPSAGCIDTRVRCQCAADQHSNHIQHLEACQDVWHWWQAHCQHLQPLGRSIRRTGNTKYCLRPSHHRQHRRPTEL